jgi:SAM-dependent methyltransferase
VTIYKIWTTITPHLPYSFYKVGISIYSKLNLGILCRYVEWQEAKYRGGKEFDHVPPASLRFRVHGILDKHKFKEGGKNSAQDIVNLLQKVDRGLDSFNDILDFGCGCGRVLTWLTNYSTKPTYYGTDIDVQAITWSSNNLNFAKFNTNEAVPPMIYNSETFDLIYAISVFTHLDEERQFLWLNELRRILKPNGILILTLSGQGVWKRLPYDVKSELERSGFLYLKTGADMGGIFPDWYQNAYHTENYVMNKYANSFNVLHYIPCGMSNNQDAVILQKV